MEFVKTAGENLTPTHKLFYIDNLRVLLIALVILHHALVTYGAPGGWYYSEKTTHLGALIPMLLIVAVNQSFFMGFFFFLSALFIGSSVEKKGVKLFLLDRLKRLGIPLIFYSFVLSPFMSYIVYRFGHGHDISLIQYLSGYDDWIEFGVLWFVAALLIFTFIYIASRRVATSDGQLLRVVPKNIEIFLFAVCLGLISFIVRIFFPVGWVLHPLGFQPAHFTQYIAMFLLGIIAARNNWLASITIKKIKPFFILAICLIFIVFPLLYLLKVLTNSPMEAFSGGGTYLSLLTALWEQMLGVSIMMVLLGYGKERWNRQSSLLKGMARSAYAVYIFHPLVLIVISLAVMNLTIDPSEKVLFVAPMAIVLSYLLGGLLVKLPLVKNIL